MTHMSQIGKARRQETKLHGIKKIRFTGTVASHDGIHTRMERINVIGLMTKRTKIRNRDLFNVHGGDRKEMMRLSQTIQTRQSTERRRSSSVLSLSCENDNKRSLLLLWRFVDGSQCAYTLPHSDFGAKSRQPFPIKNLMPLESSSRGSPLFYLYYNTKV